MREPDKQPAGQAKPDMEALSTLYNQYGTRVFTYFQYRCDDSAAAQDLTMQVFERLLRCLPRYQAEQAPFPAWLFAIVRHVAADWQRQQYLRRFIPWEQFAQRASAEPGPEQRALAQRSDRERDMVGLRFSSGLTNRAIAKLTGLSESNVAVILYRALNKLRQHLADLDEISCPAPINLMEAEVEVKHE